MEGRVRDADWGVREARYVRDVLEKRRRCGGRGDMRSQDGRDGFWIDGDGLTGV